MKTINKFLSILLATILILSLFPVSLAHATDNTVTFSAETDVISAQAGDIVNVSVNMTENSNLAALTLALNYDNTALRMVSASTEKKYGWEEFNTAYANNTLLYLVASAQPKSVEGTLFTVQFELLKDGCTEISLSVNELADIDLKAIPSLAQSTKIHNLDDGVATEPTCIDKGFTTYTCTCGFSYQTDDVDAKGHSFGGWTTEIEPNCTENGFEKQTCSVCGETEINELSAIGHDYDYDNGILIRPTETSKGYYIYICKNDASHTTTVTVESADYTEYDNALQKLEGYLLNSNLTTESKEFIFSEVVKIIQNNSDFLNFVLNDRRDLIASEQYIVDNLTNEINEVFQVVDSIIANCEAGNHIVRAYTPDNNATCIVNGTKRGACYVCGTKVVVDDENNPALGHDIIVDNAVSPDCVNTGLEEGSHCSRCDDVTVEQVIVPALGHKYESEITTPATHTENGEMTYTCHCGDSYTETINATGDHYYVPTVIEPTCTEAGFTTYTCVCGDTYVADETPAKGHSFGDWLVVTAPTCINEGLEERVCIAGDKTETNELPAKGHSHNSVVTAPTCTEAGFTTYTCACGDNYIDDETPATGHSFSKGNCTVCGEDDPDYYVFSVKEPSRTTIRNKDGIVLHTEIEGNAPEGSYVEWTSSNSNYGKTVMNDGQSLRVIANNKGYTTFTATLYDVNGNELATDDVELYSDSGLFQKIVGFFRSLFGMTTVYEN